MKKILFVAIIATLSLASCNMFEATKIATETTTETVVETASETASETFISIEITQ